MKTMEWISVKERLPDYMQTCIVHVTTGFVTMAQYGGGGQHKTVFVSGDQWYIVDFWMPLPEPPKP